ncbi:MAG: alpha/beta hydrolase [Beijerinckiaceae bacterium]
MRGTFTLDLSLPLRRCTFAAALAAALGGCMPTLDGVGSGLKATASSVLGPTKEARAVPILVASTRPESGSKGGRAKFSQIRVTVPPGHRPGVIERPTITPESPGRHFTVQRLKTLDHSDVTGAVTQEIAGKQGLGRDVLVFVHGFNNSREEASFRLAQIVEDTGFNGLPVLFSWPSQQSLWGYGADKEGATASRDALEGLLVELGANPDVGRVHVLAHSMGTWLAMESLRQAAIGGRGNLGGKIGSVMLAAPDLDLDVFQSQIARLGKADHISLFVASDDRALAVSSRIAGQRARVGALDLANKEHREAVTALGVRVYDMTGSRDGSDYFRHGTFAEAPQIVKVIGSRLKDAPVREASAAQATVE